MNGRLGRVTEAQVRHELLREADRTARRRFRVGAAVVLALALIVGTLAARFAFSLVRVRTLAMGDALRSGDVALCLRSDSPLYHKEPERGALVLLRYSDSGLHRQAVRRIIGLPGDEIAVDEGGHVSLNGEPLEEPYALWRATPEPEEAQPGGAIENPFIEPEEQEAPTEAVHPAEVEVTFPVTVPEGSLFVLSDDREELLDSRIVRFGMVNGEDVLGWPLVVLWPAHRMGNILMEP